MKTNNSIENLENVIKNCKENLEFVIGNIIDCGLRNTITTKSFSETVKSLDKSDIVNLDKIIKKILVKKINDIKISLINGGGVIGLANTQGNSIESNDFKEGTFIRSNDWKRENQTKSDKSDKSDKSTKQDKEPIFDQATAIAIATALDKVLNFNSLDENLCDSCSEKDTCTSPDKKVTTDIKDSEKVTNETKDSEKVTENDTKKSYDFVIPLNEVKNFKKLQKAINLLRLNLNVSDIYKVDNGIFYFNSPQGKNSFDTKRISFDN